MVLNENLCNSCAECIHCNRKHQSMPRLYCDVCGKVVETLYKVAGDELCENCLLEAFDTINIEDFERCEE